MWGHVRDAVEPLRDWGTSEGLEAFLASVRNAHVCGNALWLWGILAVLWWGGVSA